MSKEIERVARAVYETTLSAIAEDDPGSAPAPAWSELIEKQKDFARLMARAAIEEHTAALAEAGLVIVPREPTEAMLDRGYDQSGPIDGAIAYAVVGEIWQAMIDAARGAID